MHLEILVNFIQQKQKKNRYHIDLCIICHFLCPGGKEESIARLFKMTQCWTQSTNDGSTCISTQRMLQYTSKLRVSIWYMTTSFSNTAKRNSSPTQGTQSIMIVKLKMELSLQSTEVPHPPRINQLVVKSSNGYLFKSIFKKFYFCINYDNKISLRR